MVILILSQLSGAFGSVAGPSPRSAALPPMKGDHRAQDLELDDLRLLEDGGERREAHGSDVVVFETASEGWGGDGERVGVSVGIGTKANTRAAAHSRLVICVFLRMAASAETPAMSFDPMSFDLRLRARSRAEMVRDQECQGALTET